MNAEAQEILDGLIEIMRLMEQEKRLEVFRELKDEFCEHCGRIQPPGLGCQCWNDD